MTRMRLMSKIRKQAYYKPMLRALDDLGIEDFAITAPTGRGHPILRFEHNGGRHRIPLPGSPTGGSEAAHYIVQAIKHRLAGQRK